MSLYTRHDLIFGHEGDACAATSVILIGVLAALIGSVFMAIGPRFKQEPRPTGDAYIGGASAPVRVIGHAPRENGSCEQQVWPNIDQRCLVRREAMANSGNTSSPEQNDKLSRLTPTATTMDRQSSSQDATNFVNRSPLSNHASVRAGIIGPSIYTSVRFASDCFKQG